MLMKPPVLTCPDLSQWPEGTFDVYHDNILRLQNISNQIGLGSDVYKERVRFFQQLCAQGSFSNIKSAIRTSIDVLAFCNLLVNDDEFYKKIGIRKDFLEALFLHQRTLNSLCLKTLVRLYFDKFSQLFQHRDFDFFHNMLKQQLSWLFKNAPHQAAFAKSKSTQPNSTQDANHLTNQLANQGVKQGVNQGAKLTSLPAKTGAKVHVYGSFYNLCENAALFFQKDAVNALVNESLQHFSSLEECLNYYSLENYRNGEFVQQCQAFYYVNALKQIPLGQDHSVLQQVVQNKNCTLLVSNMGPCVGHAALRILIDRCRNQDISESWLNTILAIASDPRLPKTTTNYINWWGYLDESYTEQVIRWLSKNDLKLFLEILQDLSLGNKDMARMFPERKEFIERLLDLGFVSQTRLFLTSTAISYLKNKYGSTSFNQVQFAEVSPAHETSYIYLNLCNQVHMMEGTHTCSLRMMGALPVDNRFTNYAIQTFSDHECRTGFVTLNGSNYSDYIEQPHNANSDWQRKPIEFLRRHGLDFPLERPSYLSW